MKGEVWIAFPSLYSVSMKSRTNSASKMLKLKGLGDGEKRTGSRPRNAGSTLKEQLFIGFRWNLAAFKISPNSNTPHFSSFHPPSTPICFFSEEKKRTWDACNFFFFDKSSFSAFYSCTLVLLQCVVCRKWRDVKKLFHNKAHCVPSIKAQFAIFQQIDQ